MLSVDTAFDFLETKLPETCTETLNAKYGVKELELEDSEKMLESHIQFNRYFGDTKKIPPRYVVWNWSNVDTYNPVSNAIGGIRRKRSEIRGIEFSVGLYSKDDDSNPIVSAKRFRRDFFRLAQALQDTNLFQVSYSPSGYNSDINYHFASLQLELR